MRPRIAALLTFTASFLATAAFADQTLNRVPGSRIPDVHPRPELYSPPPERPTGEQKLKAWRYRDELGAEIQRQERQIGPDDPRSLYPLQGLRNERQRMNRALGKP